ncbi:MAG: 4Fe-4S binding protein [Candidatus Zhuqueibacterota bacterium]
MTTLRITAECLGCGACLAVCPVEAISEDGEVYTINTNRCCLCVGYSENYLCKTVCGVPGAILSE